MCPPAPPPPVLDVYYAAYCAPCRLELPVVAAVAQHDGIAVRIEIVGDAVRARRDIAQSAPALLPVSEASALAPRAALLAAGDGDAILPYARVLASGGRVCARWRGLLSRFRARALLSACATALTSPQSR